MKAFGLAVGTQQKCAVTGVGAHAEITKKLLEIDGHEVVCFIDNIKEGRPQLDSTKERVVSCEELVHNSENIIVILNDTEYSKRIFDELRKLGYPRELIFWNAERTLLETIPD